MYSVRIRIKDAKKLKMICCAAFFIMFMLFQNKWLYSQSRTYTQPVIVSTGESLWDIANKYKKENEDVRRFIQEIKEINLLETSEVFEGQEIKVPIYAQRN